MLCSTIVLGWAGPAWALTELDLGSSSRPNDPSMDPFHLKIGRERDSVGAIRTYQRVDNEEDDGIILTPLALGSSNAIRENWVVTAAHVVTGAEDLDVQFGDAFDLPGNGFFNAREWYVPKTYDGNVISESDIALIRVGPDGDGDAISDDHLTSFNHDLNRPLLGKEYTMAGFGTYGDGQTGNILFDGQKRGGKNIYDDRVGLNGSILISDFDIDPEPRDFYGDQALREGIYGPHPKPPEDFRIPYESSSAEGDSGGGQYRSGQLTSVTSFGSIGSLFGGYSGDVDLSRWADWIEQVIADPQSETADGIGVVKGSFLNPIKVGDSDDEGGDSLGALHAQQQHYAGLFQKYFNPERPALSRSESLQVLGLARRSEAAAKAMDADELVKLLGLDVGPHATDGEIAEKADRQLARLLQESFGNHEQLAKLINEGYGESQSAFARGLADLDELEKEFDEINLSDGDANLDDQVNLEDLELLAANWQEDGRDWTEGDFSFDHLVDEGDLARIEDNWDDRNLTFKQALTTVNIPEPSTIAVFGLAGLPLLLRRRSFGE